MLKEASRTVLVWVSVLWDRARWRFDEWWLERRLRRVELMEGPMVEVPPLECAEPVRRVASQLDWYAEFFKRIAGERAYWQAQELFLWTYPDLVGLDEGYVPEHWEWVR